VEKVYWAIVEGQIEPPEGQLVDYLRKDERHRKVHVTGSNVPGAQLAELAYRELASGKETGRQGDKEIAVQSESPCLPFSLSPGLSCLEVRPLTGRKHQIRVQLAAAGFPIVGDRKYGSSRPFQAGIALHSRRLVLVHPVSKMLLELEAPPPKSWQRFMGGV